MVSKKAKANPWLPDGVVSDVLRHLPVKSLLRLQSVSKTWRSIIHHREFVNSYRSRPESRISVVRSDTGKVECAVRCSRTLQVKAEQSLPIQTLITETESAARPCTVIGSVDGLFLFQNSPIHLDTSSSPTPQLQLLLWNPSIQRFRMLPMLPSSGLGVRITLSVGIGYDPSINDYKHVRIACHVNEKTNYCAMIYTVGTNSWRIIPIKAQCVFHGYEDNRQRVCFRGVLYLITQRRAPRKRRQHVLSFDLRTEEFSSAQLPKGASDLTTWYLKCASDGSNLALVGYYGDNWSVWWATGEGGGLTWTKNYAFSSTLSRIGQSGKIGVRDVLNIDLNMMSISRDEASMVLLLKLEDCVASYDIGEARNGNGEIVVEEKRTPPSEIHSFDIVCAAPYTESLLLLI